MQRKGCFVRKRIFAYICVFVFIAMMFQAPIAKAADTTTEFDALFPAQTIPGTKVTIENNLNNQSSVRTELAVWENDLGIGSTDGSYVGPIFESSLFEVDYKPYLENETVDFTDVVYNSFKPVIVPEAVRGNVGLNLSSTNWEFPYSLYPRHFNQTDIKQFTSYYPVAKKRSIISLAMNVTFTNRMILSGATEFYVRVPISAGCINFEELRPTLSFFKLDSGYNPDKLWMVDGYAIIYDPWPKTTVYDTNGTLSVINTEEGRIRTDYSHITPLRGVYDGNGAQIVQFVTDNDIINDNIYCHIRGTIEPNVEYLIVFSAVLKGKPLIFLTEDDLCSNGRCSNIQVADLNFRDVTQRTYAEAGVEAPSWNHYLTVVRSDLVPGYPDELIGPRLPYSSSLVNETINLPVDLGFSFVFINGRGDFGMFGHKYHFEPDDAFIFYKEIEQPDNDQFISIMIPFISENWIDVNITVDLLPKYREYTRFEPIGVLGRNTSAYTYYNESMREFGYIFTNWWQAPIDMTYTDYILFSTPYKIDRSEMIGDVWIKVIVTFNRAADVTFMFSTLSDDSYEKYIRDKIEFGSFDLTIGTNDYTVPSYVRPGLFYVTRNTIVRPMGTPIWTAKQGLYDSSDPYSQQYHWDEYKRVVANPDDLEIAHYELFSSVQLTDGLWHELVTSPEGYQYATHFFERRIAIGVVDLWIDTTNNQSVEKVSWYDEGLGLWGQAWEMFTQGNIIGAISAAIAGGISLLWNGLKAFVGVIIGVFKAAWNGLVGVGKFIYSIVSSFIGKITSIIGDIVDAAERILSIAIYIIAILIFMYVVSWGGKLLYLAKVPV